MCLLCSWMLSVRLSCSPALRALPQSELTLMTSAAGSQMAPLLPCVDNIMVERLIGQDGDWKPYNQPQQGNCVY